MIEVISERQSLKIYSTNSKLYHEIFTDKPKVTVKPQSSVFTGDTVTLSCDVGRSTGRTIIWFKDIDRIQTGDVSKTLRDVTVSDGGKYACALEEQTTVSQGVMLTVRSKCCFYRTI